MNSSNYDRVKHFLDEGKSVTIEIEPQCIKCKNNLGCRKCSVFWKIPTDILLNQSKCPFKLIE